MTSKKTCKTCVFKMPHQGNWVCAGGGAYKYGDVIEKDLPCDGWKISYPEFCKQEKKKMDKLSK